jgi:hypothetical protein
MALRLIRDIAQDSSRVVVTVHARKRMLQRRISRPQVLECLLKGQLAEGPALDIHGNWTCTLRWRHAGDYIRIAAAIKQDPANGRKVIVITVMHED